MYKIFEFSLLYFYKFRYMNMHVNIIDTKLEYNERHLARNLSIFKI